MAIIRYQDADVSVQTQKNKNFCWAACIEMVTAKYNKEPVSAHFQCLLAEKQVELLKGKITIHFDPQSCLDCGALGDTGLKRERNLYLRMFKQICQIECNEYKIKAFPDWRYIEEQTAKGCPVIVSGIYIPSCLDVSHAVVFTGCFLEKNLAGQYISWVLAHDPYVPNPCQSQQARKTAWIYEELKKTHKVTSEENSMDGKAKPLIYVSDFRLSSDTPKVKGIQRLHSFPCNDGRYPVFTDAQLEGQVDFLMESLFGKQKNFFLFNYFGFKKRKKVAVKGLVRYKSINGAKLFSNKNDPTLIKTLTHSDFTAHQTELEEAKQGKNLSLLPIYQDGKPIIDIYIQHDGDNKNRILGIQEHQATDILDAAALPPGMGVSTDAPTILGDAPPVLVDFDHNKPNYTILDIAPFGFRFMVYEHDGETLYAPIANYPSIEATCGASWSSGKIRGLLNTKLPTINDDDVHSY